MASEEATTSVAAFAVPHPPCGGFPQIPPDNAMAGTAIRRRRRRHTAKNTRPLPAFSFPDPPWKDKNVLFTRVRVLDNRSLPEDNVRREFDRLIGKKIARTTVENAVDNLSEWYRVNGYLFSAVIVDTWPSSSGGLLILRCIESLLGDVQLIPVSKDGVVLTDNTKVSTRPYIVARAMGVTVGKPFKWNSSAVSGLMALGVFAKSWVEVDIVNDDKVILKVFVREEPRGRFEPGFGMNQDGKVYGDLSLLDKNFLGKAQTLRFEWQKRLDTVRAAAGIEFYDPRIGSNIPISYSMRGFRKSDSARQLPREDRPRGEANANQVRLGPIHSIFEQELDSDRDGMVVDATYSFGERGNAALTVGPIVERIHWRELVNSEINTRIITQAAWKSTLSHVTFSPAFAPKEGHRLNLEHIVGNVHRGQGTFHKFAAALAQQVPLTRWANLSISTVVGIGTRNVPLHETTVLGGFSSVRGYMYGELGRATSWRTARVEVRVPFAHDDSNASDTGLIKPGRKAVREGSEKVGKIITPGTPAFGPKLNERKGLKIPMGATNIMEKLPNMTGYAFFDTASQGAFETAISGSSFGVGMRVAGLINVELAKAAHGRDPKLTVSLVDHRIHS